jgi:hypothetical protein
VNGLRCLIVLLLATPLAAQEGQGMLTQQLTVVDNGNVVTRDVRQLLLTATEEGVSMTADGEAVAGDWLVLEHDVDKSLQPRFQDDLWRLQLANGEILVGEFLRADDASVSLDSRWLGAFEVSLDDVKALAKVSAPTPKERPDQDVIRFDNGDVASGFYTGTRGNVLLLATDVGELEVPMSRLSSLSLADAGGTPSTRPGVAAGQPTVRVALLDGTVLLADSLSIQPGVAALRRGDRQVGVDLDHILAAEPVEQPGLWLTDLPMLEQTHEPYLSVVSLPIVRSGLGTDRSLVLRSRSEVTVDVPRAGRLVMQVQIDQADERPLADARVIIRQGEQVLYERDSLQAADGAIAVDVPVAGGELSLRVEYGSGLDVQDQVVFVRPVLLVEQEDGDASGAR